MTRGELCRMLEEVAKQYRKDANASLKRNRHMHQYRGARLSQVCIDAILVDFINAVGCFQGLDLGLDSKDLKKERNERL